MVNKQMQEFDNAFLEDLVRKKDIKKDRGLPTSYNIEHLLSFADGSIGFIAEKYYITTSTTTDSDGNMRTRYTYHSDEICDSYV